MNKKYLNEQIINKDKELPKETLDPTQYLGFFDDETLEGNYGTTDELDLSKYMEIKPIK